MEHGLVELVFHRTEVYMLHLVLETQRTYLEEVLKQILQPELYFTTDLLGLKQQIQIEPYLPQEVLELAHQLYW